MVAEAGLEFLVYEPTEILGLFSCPVRLIWCYIAHYLQITLLHDFP